MPTAVPGVTAGQPITEAWGDAVSAAVTELQTAPPAHAPTHAPGAADPIATAIAGASAVADTAAAGTSTSLARADHRHGREGFAAPQASAVGDANAGGSASTISRSDHRHGREAFGAVAAAAAGDASTDGTATTVSRSDHKHGLPTAVAGASAPGDTAAAGSSTSVARADHRHAREAAYAGAGLTQTVNVVIDGGGAVITTGIKADLVIDYAATITKWTLLADQAGAIVVDIWKDSYANYPPVIGDVITASAKPTLSAAAKAQSAALTGWTVAIAAGDVLRINVNSAATVQRVTLALTIVRA